MKIFTTPSTCMWIADVLIRVFEIDQVSKRLNMSKKISSEALFSSRPARKRPSRASRRRDSAGFAIAVAASERWVLAWIQGSRTSVQRAFPLVQVIIPKAWRCASGFVLSRRVIWYEVDENTWRGVTSFLRQPTSAAGERACAPLSPKRVNSQKGVFLFLLCHSRTV